MLSVNYACGSRRHHRWRGKDGSTVAKPAMKCALNVRIAPVYMRWYKLVVNVVGCEILSQQWCGFVVESVDCRFKST